MLENFHFIHPWWLTALLPLALLVWRMCGGGSDDNAWQGVIDAHLLPLLQVGQAGRSDWLVPAMCGVGGLVATLALADPTWARRPQPLFQTDAARVVVLDLNDSMNAIDLKPSRLVRARYKVEDVLARASEGQTGLVVYAGDAFTVAPLTRDANTIRSMLQVLDPSLMPAQGDRADLGLAKAGELLRQAGLGAGQVLLMADGVDALHAKAAVRAAAKLNGQGYKVSVLGVGTESGAPVIDAQGGLQRDGAGGVVVSRLGQATLEAVARAGGGQYRTISEDGDALRALLASGAPRTQASHAQTAGETTAWKEEGPAIVVLLLPLAALAFRRNWLVGLSLAVALAAPAQSAEAASWRDAWQRPDQRAARALAAGRYAEAAQAARDAADPSLRGSADYKAGDYERAADEFAHAGGADADYNRGNALARLGRYQDAIAAYDKSLSVRPADGDAKFNKAAVEALLKREPPPQASGSSSKTGQSSDGQGGGTGKKSNDSAAHEGARSAGPTAQANPQPSRGTSPNNAAPLPDQSGSTSATGMTGSPGSRTDAKRPDSSNAFAEAARKAAEQGHGVSAPPTQAQAQAQATQAGTGVQPARPIRDAAAGQAQRLDSEEQLAAEQWLRRIPDDPGGLLRRKFLYQYRQHQQHGASDGS